MRLREQPLGQRNLVGGRVKTVRKDRGMKQKHLIEKLSEYGIEINISGVSKLEGQIRSVTDIELLALSKILDVSVEWLLTGNNDEL